MSTGALVCVVLGLGCGLLVLVRTRSVGQALPVLLDFLLAAGLLRLSADASWRMLAAAALVVAVRWLVTDSGLRLRGVPGPPPRYRRRRELDAGPVSSW